MVEFGDKVFYKLDAFEGETVCIGTPHYAPKGDVVVLADEKAYGMPINIKWCNVMGKGEFAKAGEWRSRYIEKYGSDFLIPA